MSFGIYVHIPYCLQRCLYCDFATYEKSKILPPENYIELLKKEMSFKQNLFGKPLVDTIFFGGGTPSLLPAHLIIEVLEHLANLGFTLAQDSEITIEINPATVDEEKLKAYLQAGINRFSVGAQTFDDRLLKMVHREHSAKQTMQTLELLQKYDVNYNFDLLFALPHQTMEGFQKDLNIVKELRPSHLSPYCLTVPPHHVLSRSRPLDDEQVAMFDLLHQTLVDEGYEQYEISNYALPKKESRHNLLYWEDQNYWGTGLSAHSYRGLSGDDSNNWGHRFWNLKNIDDFTKQISAWPVHKEMTVPDELPENQFETLDKADSLTDFCHTSLRLMKGLSEDAVEKKFGAELLELVQKRLQKPLERGLVEKGSSNWALTRNGIYLSNQVFEDVHFESDQLSQINPQR